MVWVGPAGGLHGLHARLNDLSTAKHQGGYDWGSAVRFIILSTAVSSARAGLPFWRPRTSTWVPEAAGARPDSLDKRSVGGLRGGGGAPCPWGVGETEAGEPNSEPVYEAFG